MACLSRIGVKLDPGSLCIDLQRWATNFRTLEADIGRPSAHHRFHRGIMVLVPSYLEVDNLVVPLAAAPQTERSPARVFQRNDSTRPWIDGLKWIVDTLISKDRALVLRTIRDKGSFALSPELIAYFIPVTEMEEGEFDKHVESWQRLTGYNPDLSDAYSVGASFLRNCDLVIPRLTFLKLMTALYDLNEAVREGRMEPRVDASMPIPPLPPEPKRAPWTDDQLLELEEHARKLDEDEPQGRMLDHPELPPRVVLERGNVTGMVEVLYRRFRDREPNLPARYEALGLKKLLGYHRALETLEAYVRDPERIAIVEEWLDAAGDAAACAKYLAGPTTLEGDDPTSLVRHDVSVDLFRLPVPARLRPSDVPLHQWLAHCEGAYLHARVTRHDDIGEGELFTRVLGREVRLRFRDELGYPPKLWRAELAPSELAPA